MPKFQPVYRPVRGNDPHTHWPVLVLEDEEGREVATLTPPPGSKASREIVHQLAAAPHLAAAVEAALTWLDAYGRQTDQLIGGEAELERQLAEAVSLYRGNPVAWSEVEARRAA